ncbi:peptidylprolyl isomerase [Roseibium sp.]|uniref:peptidylprolyl isomerase n=1 Tax=Roseibium sp. TaxID=1936156 RepID=UPI003A97F569
MATLYTNPSLNTRPDTPGGEKRGYDGYIEPDTKIPPKAKPVVDEISVDGVVIAEADILSEAQNHPAENPGAAVRAAAKALVVRELLLQEAGRQGIGDVACETNGHGRETPDDARIRALLDEEVDVPAATEAECRRYFEINAAKFCTPALYEVRHILLAADRDGDVIAWDKTRLTALALCKRLNENPGGFSAAAAEFSACSSAQECGRIGQIASGETTEEFDLALTKMLEGEISEQPVESRFGFHVIALDKIVPPRQLPFEHVKEKIAAWLEASSWSRAVSQYISILASQADIQGITLEGADGPLVQ